MKIPQKELTNCEELIMKVIWDTTFNSMDGISCRDIKIRLKARYNIDYEITTIYTFLSHLKDKGYIRMAKQGVSIYFPVKSEEEYLRMEFHRLNALWFGGDKIHFQCFIAMNDV